MRWRRHVRATKCTEMLIVCYAPNDSNPHTHKHSQLHLQTNTFNNENAFMCVRVLYSIYFAIFWLFLLSVGIFIIRSSSSQALLCGT